MKSKILLSLSLIAALALTGCGNSAQNNKKNKNVLDIHTTVYPLEYFTEAIGGKYVNVDTIYPPGTDEHTFDPSQKDIIKMANSDLFFYIGYNLEGFVTKAKPILKGEGVTTIAVGESVEVDEHTHDGKEEDGHDHGGINPHLWLDPVYSIEMAETIKDELTKKMPEQKSYFTKRFDDLSDQLTQLDKELADTIKAGRTNKVIVSHAAYGYWEDRYGLQQIGVTGLTSSSEPSQKQLAGIVTTAKEEDLHYVVYEQNISSKLTKILQKEMGAKALQFHNLSVLTDQDIKAGEDYFSLMENNVKTLQTALQ